MNSKLKNCGNKILLREKVASRIPFPFLSLILIFVFLVTTDSAINLVLSWLLIILITLVMIRKAAVATVASIHFLHERVGKLDLILI